jgi:eukaryotic-like serine/threonine-protein kinase
VVTYGVYIRKTDGSPAILLGEGNALALSPDGKWAITETQVSPGQLKLLPTGAGQSRDLTNDSINHNWAHWFADGKRILFSGNESGKGEKLYVFEVDSGKSLPVTSEGVNGNSFAISPDSQWVAAIGPDQRTYLYSINGADPRLVSGMNQGEQPITWSAEGNSLYAFQPGEVPARVYRVDLKTGQRTIWKELMPTDPAGVENIGPILMTADARDLRVWLPPHARRFISGRRAEVESLICDSRPFAAQDSVARALLPA